MVSTWEYDGLDRLKRLKHVKGANTLLDLQYQFSDVNNITQIIDNAGTHNYSFDPLDRLTAATHPNQPNESYTLDDVGNPTASHQGSSYSYQTFNRLVTANSSSFSYNANGNLTAKTEGSESWTYAWDYENRLKQATLSGGVTVNYSYDALGRRILRSSSATGTTKFVYDGADVIRDLDGSGNMIGDYLNGPGVDNKLRQTISGTASYFVADHLGTTRALTDASGAVTSSISYDSYGNVSSGSVSTRYMYTGRENDNEVAMMSYRARWYDPAQGRFISEDPIGLQGGINLFGYVANNPTRFSDPSGLCTQDSTLAQRIKQRICGVIPSGRTVGVSGGLGLVGGPVGGGEVVINYNSGQMSAFAFGGAQVGWNGGAQGSACSGFVYGLNDSNSNYSGGFTGVSGGAGVGGFAASSSGGLTGGARGLIPNPREVTAVGVSAGASLLGGASGGFTATHYTYPLQLGKNPLGLGLVDIPLYLARQVCR